MQRASILCAGSVVRHAFSPFAPEMPHSCVFPGAHSTRQPAIPKHPKHLQVILDIKYQCCYNGFVESARFFRALRTMLARQAVLLTPPKSSHPSQLLYRQQSAPISPLAATLMNLPASVANKRLTVGLSPLDATLTKNRGWGPRLSTFRSVNSVFPVTSALNPAFSASFRHSALPRLNSQRK